MRSSNAAVKMLRRQHTLFYVLQPRALRVYVLAALAEIEYLIMSWLSWLSWRRLSIFHAQLQHKTFQVISARLIRVWTAHCGTVVGA